MRFSSPGRRAKDLGMRWDGGLSLAWRLLPLISSTLAISLTPVPATNIDFDSLGRIAIAGDFESVSLYQFEEQHEGVNNNGSQSVIASLPEGIFGSLSSADAQITSMCPFVMRDGTNAGIIVGGNFTSLGGADTNAVAMIDPSSGKVTPLPGIQGTVNAVLCDQDTNSVYVGGSFKAANSTNAIAWVGTDGWTNLAFEGFNGPVTSITKAPNGHIVFGGSFSGLGNTSTPTQRNSQVINLSTATLTSGSTTTQAGFNDPKNVVCKLNGSDGAGNTWLAQDRSPAFWEASFRFGFEPTLLRLWNTNQDGRGTKTFRMTALPLNGIMNFTFTDPTTGQEDSCQSTCPLAHNSSYQDFHFVNTVGMNAFRIDISDWYGDGAGLDGIELFEDDMYAYAVNDFNEPACADTSFVSTATSTGPWSVTPSGQSQSDYLTVLADSSNPSGTSVVFKPDIRQSGNYTVTIFTPGCVQSNSCSNRGIVNVTGIYASTGAEANQPQGTTLYQTNNNDKYDTIFMGYVDAASDSFRPTVTLQPAAGAPSTQQVVASRVRFQMLNSTGGLNGLFEFDPNQAVVDQDFSTSAINRAGTDLHPDADVRTLTTVGDTIYAGGQFSDDTFNNIMAFTDNQTKSLPSNGLNGAVSSIYSTGGLIYMGGSFNATSQPGVSGLSNVAAYSPSDNAWVALGQGLNGPVSFVVPLSINVSETLEDTITFSGSFTQISAFGSNAPIQVDGLAIWVPSQKNWLQNLKGARNAYLGQITAQVNLTDAAPLLAGTFSSQGQAITGAVGINGPGTGSLNQLPINIQSAMTTSTLTKRDASSAPVQGVITGTFYENQGQNVTILAGHFSATATNGSIINNVMFLNGTNEDQVTGFAAGISTDSTVYAVTVATNTLFVGGTITGNISNTAVNGLILYDMASAQFVPNQPPALSGDGVIVNAIAAQPGSSNVFVGGNFSSAGSLPCPNVCVFNTATNQWVRPGIGFSGLATSFVWASSQTLLVGGNLTINGNLTAVASYDTKSQTWSASTPMTSVPGPVTAMAPGSNDASKLWISGTALNGSTYLMHLNGDTQNSIGPDLLGSSSNIRGMRVLNILKNHASNDLLSNNQVLLVTGQLEFPNFGNASAALFNGTGFQALVLSSMNTGLAGSLSQLITSKSVSFSSSGHHRSKGIVILVALCAALGALFLIILIGLIIERVQRRRQGYTAIPNTYTDKHSNLGRVPPEHLFSNLGRSPGTQAPTV